MEQVVKKVMIKSISDLRNFSVCQLFKAIFIQIHIDPEYAYIAAYHINHSDGPKDWGKNYNQCSTNMIKVKIIPDIPDDCMVKILNVLDYNKTKGLNERISLLPQNKKG